MIRSRKQIEIDRLKTLLRDADREIGVLANDEFAGEAYVRWNSNPKGATMDMRRAALAERVSSIRAALDNVTDDAVIRGSCSSDEQRHYLHEAGIDVRAWYERFDGFGNLPAGMGGFKWCHDGRPVADGEAAQIARMDVRFFQSQPGHYWHRDPRIASPGALLPAVDPFRAAIFVDRGEEIPASMLR